MFNNELAREKAEEERVKAEKARSHAESNEGSGRVEAEEARVAAEKNRHDRFEKEFSSLTADPAHYVTPGAKRYFRRVTYGYLILAVATIIGIWSATNHNDTNLRKEINSYAEKSCLGSIPTLQKYNNLVDTQIIANFNAKILNESKGRLAAAKLNEENIKRLVKDKLTVPTIEQCNKPIIKE